MAVASRQATAEELNKFIENAHMVFSHPGTKALYEQEYDQEAYDRWEIEGGNTVQIFRTRSVREFSAAWAGVLKVVEALKANKYLPGISIRVRGTERFFDVEGIEGAGDRTWIAFDLRSSGAPLVLQSGAWKVPVLSEAAVLADRLLRQRSRAFRLL